MGYTVYIESEWAMGNRTPISGDSRDEICKKIRQHLKAMGVPSKSSTKKDVAITDEEWRASLTFNPLFAHIDIGYEEKRARFWCQTHRRKFTRQFFENWLLRNTGDKPVEPPKGNGPNFRESF